LHRSSGLDQRERVDYRFWYMAHNLPWEWEALEA
jgi:hypothetical protein